MEQINIDARRAKLILSPEDMNRYGLTSARPSVAALREMLRGLADTGDKVYIRMYESKHGGCEIFVNVYKPNETGEMSARAAEHNSGEEGVMAETTGGITQTNTAERKTLIIHKTTQAAYLFEHFDNLTEACRRLLERGCRGGELYLLPFCGKNVYLLLVSRPLEYGGNGKYSIIAEYGKEKNAAQMKLCAGEYGKILCRDNALSRLAAL